jgi:hypothetical protein
MMAITERKKQRLLDRLRRVLDPETAELLMEVTVPANVDLASRSDITALGSELRGEMSKLRGEMGELRGAMSELRGEMGELRGEMRAGFAALEQRIYTRVLPIMSGVLGLVVTAATIIAGRVG